MVVAFLVVCVLLIPPVFQRAGNGLVATANWTSYRIGWDWHRIHPRFAPRNDLMNKPEGALHPAVPVFLALAVLNVLGLAVRRFRYFFAVTNLIWGVMALLTISLWMGFEFRKPYHPQDPPATSSEAPP